MSSVYMYVNFRFTKTVSLNVKLHVCCNDSLKTPSFIAQLCLFIPLQEKSTVTGIRLIGEILFTKKAGEATKKTACCSHTHSQLEVSNVGWNGFLYKYFVLR